MTVVSFPSIMLSALPLTDTMKIKQTLDSTAEATVISENNQNAEDGGDIEYGNFHRRSLTAIAELDESNMIGNPVVISKDDTTVHDADTNLPMIGINKVVEHIGYMVDEIESPYLLCSKLSNDLDVVHENHKSMCISRYPGYVVPSFRARCSDLKLEEVARFIQSNYIRPTGWTDFNVIDDNLLKKEIYQLIPAYEDLLPLTTIGKIRYGGKSKVTITILIQLADINILLSRFQLKHQYSKLQYEKFVAISLAARVVTPILHYLNSYGWNADLWFDINYENLQIEEENTAKLNGNLVTICSLPYYIDEAIDTAAKQLLLHP